MCCVDTQPIAKVSATRQLDRLNRGLETRSRALSGALSIWFSNYATATMRDVRRKLKSGGLPALRRSYVEKRIKVSELHKLEADLRTLLIRYGVAQAKEAGQSAARQVGERWVIRPALLDAVAREKENKVVLIVDQTEADVRSSLKRLLSDAMSERPQPTVAELGRRIARSWFGPAMRAPSGKPDVGLRGTPAEAKLTADWAREADEATKDSEHLFSFTRAHTIARTEIGQARAMGQAIAYTDIGVELIEWLAYPDDGRSGKRQHWKMNEHKRITVAAMNGTDKSEWFELPSGERTPYPKWIGLTAGEAVNCRCNPIPVR